MGCNVGPPPRVVSWVTLKDRHLRSLRHADSKNDSQPTTSQQNSNQTRDSEEKVLVLRGSIPRTPPRGEPSTSKVSEIKPLVDLQDEASGGMGEYPPSDFRVEEDEVFPSIASKGVFGEGGKQQKDGPIPSGRTRKGSAPDTVLKDSLALIRYRCKGDLPFSGKRRRPGEDDASTSTSF